MWVYKPSVFRIFCRKICWKIWHMNIMLIVNWLTLPLNLKNWHSTAKGSCGSSIVRILNRILTNRWEGSAAASSQNREFWRRVGRIKDSCKFNKGYEYNWYTGIVKYSLIPESDCALSYTWQRIIKLNLNYKYELLLKANININKLL